jgi:ComF family protein
MILAATFRDVINLVYPPRCSVCSNPAEGSPFCPECTSQLETSAAGACPRCAMPIPDGASCPHCQGGGVYPFDSIVAAGPFRHTLRNLVHQMKYHHRWPLAEILAEWMLHDPRIAALLAETDCLIPIPLHFSRQIARGYNQADALACGLARRAGIRIARPIVRLRNTAPQANIRSRQDRNENVHQAFGLTHPRSVRDKRITLVDDVITTGATLGAAARALLPADPASINALVLAVADPKRRDFQTI